MYHQPYYHQQSKMATEMNDLYIKKVLLYLQNHDQTIIVKGEQHKAVRELCKGNDVLRVLPTGFGKSMIFTVFGSVRNLGSTKKSTVIVFRL